jgi:hypothetical protein
MRSALRALPERLRMQMRVRHAIVLSAVFDFALSLHMLPVHSLLFAQLPNSLEWVLECNRGTCNRSSSPMYAQFTSGASCSSSPWELARK